jgi:hypothetical protein
MTRIFELTPGVKDSEGVTYTVSIKGDKRKIDQIKNSINTATVWQQDFKIDLFFDDYGSGPLRFLDTHKWAIGKPFAHVLIVSAKLKNVLEKFSMPEHAFYNMTISSGSRSEDYYLLHLIKDRYVDLDYLNTTFRKFDLRTQKPATLINEEPILFKDYSDFLLKQKELVTTSDFFYDSEKYVYMQKYDIIWGHAFKIFVNEAVKTAIDQAQLKGVSLNTNVPIITNNAHSKAQVAFCRFFGPNGE